MAQRSRPPRIRAVHADVDNTGLLFIRGTGFGQTQGNSRAGIGLPNGGIFPLIINGWRPRKIEVFLPPELLAFPGSLPETRNQAYKVIVQTGRETGQNLLQDEMDVTIKPLLTSTMIDKTQVQQRVINSCLEGSSIREINIDGTVFCETDTVGAGGATEVTASAPLVSSGGATPDISLDTTPLQLRVASFCPAGSSIREINIDGTVVCEADDVGVGGGVTAEQFAALASGVANKVDKAGDTMGGDLVVNGIVSADAIVFNAPVASLVSIPAAAFQSLDNTVDTYEMRNNGVGIHQKPGAALFTDLYAPVYLPVGALITGFSASIDDRNLNVLRREHRGNASYASPLFLFPHPDRTWHSRF